MGRLVLVAWLGLLVGGCRTTTFVVTDWHGRAVSDVELTVEHHWPHGHESTHLTTDRKGRAVYRHGSPTPWRLWVQTGRLEKYLVPLNHLRGRDYVWIELGRQAPPTVAGVAAEQITRWVLNPRVASYVQVTGRPGPSADLGSGLGLEADGVWRAWEDETSTGGSVYPD